MLINHETTPSDIRKNRGSFCSKHFPAESYTFGLKGAKRAGLLPGIVPSLFQCHETLNSPIAKRK